MHFLWDQNNGRKVGKIDFKSFLLIDLLEEFNKIHKFEIQWNGFFFFVRYENLPTWEPAFGMRLGLTPSPGHVRYGPNRHYNKKQGTRNILKCSCNRFKIRLLVSCRSSFINSYLCVEKTQFISLFYSFGQCLTSPAHIICFWVFISLNLFCDTWKMKHRKEKF